MSFSYEEDTSNSIRLEKVTYHNKMFFRDIDSLSLPVPGGYHYGEDGSEENAGWAYIVPEDVSLSDNHYDARPFSFGVTVRPAGRWPFEFEADKIAAFRNVFLSHGYLSSDVGVDDLVVSDHCAFLYQTWINGNDKTYIKVNGLLFAGNDIYQFHIMANHSEEIGGDEDFVDAFLELCRDWMRRVRFDEDADEDVFEDEENGKDEPADDDASNSETTFVIPTGVKKIEESTFYNCSRLTSIVIPEGVEEIAESAFECSELTSITIPGSVKKIGESAFSECSSLATVVISEGVEEIEGSAFWFCSALTSITIPGSVKKIGEWAFCRCSSLATVVIGEGVEEIAQFAFQDCSALVSITTPKSVKKIGSFAFGYGTNSTLLVPTGSYAETYAKRSGIKYKVTDSSSKTETAPKKPKTIYETDGTKLLRYNGRAGVPAIPKDVTSIESGAFHGIAALKQLKLPVSVKRVEAGAFQDCPNLCCITIPQTVESIADNAIVNCPQAYIDAPADSYAAQYAKRSGIPMRANRNQPLSNEAIVAAREASEEEHEHKAAELQQSAEMQQRKGREEEERQRKEEERRQAEENERERKRAELRQAAAERRQKEEAELQQREAEEARRRKEEEERQQREAEAERQRKEEENRRRQQEALLEKQRQYDRLMQRIENEKRIIAENKGWFGAKAKARKAATANLGALTAQLTREFPNGRP